MSNLSAHRNNDKIADYKLSNSKIIIVLKHSTLQDIDNRNNNDIANQSADLRKKIAFIKLNLQSFFFTQILNQI